MKHASVLSRALVATLAGLGLSAGTAAAFTVTPDSDPNNLLGALLGNTQGLSNFSLTTTGSNLAFGTFTDDPFGLGSGVAISTGNVTDLPGSNPAGTNPSSDLDQPGDGLNSNGFNSFDLAQVDITFDADDTVDLLFFQYVFGSEEFLEYGGNVYNDEFELLLNGVNMAQLSDGQPVTVNSLAPTTSLSDTHPDYINNPVNSDVLVTLDGYTTLLTFEGLLNKNAENTLTFKIKDVSDGILDSAAFFKANSISTVEPVPEPSALVGLVALGLVGALRARQQRR